MIIITPVSVYNSVLENAPSRRTNPETWEIRLSVSCFISSKNLPAHIWEDGQKPLQLFIREAGYRKPLRMPSSLVSRKNTIPFVFWQICIQTWSLFYLFYIDLTHLDILITLAIIYSHFDHPFYAWCVKIFCVNTQNEGPLTEYQAYLNSFYKEKSLSILWMSPNLGGSDTPTLNPLKVFVGLSRGGHMIALHDCFLRDLHLWSSALKPTCYCYFTGHDKDKGPTDRDTHTHCNGIWLGNSIISMLLNVIFELHDWPQYFLYMNTTYQYRTY